VNVSQSEAQTYRRDRQAELGDERDAHDPEGCQYCAAGVECPVLYLADWADDMIERRMSRQERGRPVRTAAESERITRAVSGALNALSEMQARPKRKRPRNQRSWPEAQNDLHSTL
jgi:hypothetical protein